MVAEALPGAMAQYTAYGSRDHACTSLSCQWPRPYPGLLPNTVSYERRYVIKSVPEFVGQVFFVQLIVRQQVVVLLESANDGMIWLKNFTPHVNFFCWHYFAFGIIWLFIGILMAFETLDWLFSASPGAAALLHLANAPKPTLAYNDCTTKANGSKKCMPGPLERWLFIQSQPKYIMIVL